MTHTLTSYLPQDRRHALAHGRALPERTSGAALFADIAGFTPLTEALTQARGPRHGAEALIEQINAVYDTLITQVDSWRGSVIGFAGDAITCWFDASDGPAISRAAACALAMQSAMQSFVELGLPGGGTIALALKVAVAAGPIRRFVIGDPAIQCLDVLAGATMARLTAAEQLARPGQVLLDETAVTDLGASALIASWRVDPETANRYAVLGGLVAPPPESAWPALSPAMLPADALRPWLLPAVYDREQAQLGAFLTELRPAVALFLRFAGIDYDADPGAGAMLDSFIRAVQGILAGYEGTLLQVTIGDKGSYFYAAFGAPIAHEDDPRRAVLAALALRHVPVDRDVLASLQIGISQGTMRCGTYGSATRRTYGVIGDEVNLAARLMQHAAPGQVLASGRVQQISGSTFAWEPLRAVRVKGKQAPIPVATLRGIERRRAIQLQEPAYALPLIGRAAELSQLRTALERALAGQGQVVGITAEAGMGKSRLLAEGISMARQRGMTAYGGACQPTGTTSPYLVWEPIWRALFAIDLEAPLQLQRRALGATVNELAPHRVAALPLLGPLLGLSLPENDLTQGLEPKDRQAALHALLRDCLRGAARAAGQRDGGLLLVLEDLHWIDAASHDLLEELARTLAELPVLILLAYRPPDQARLQPPRIEALPHFTGITLDGLSAADVERLIRARLSQLFPGRAEAIRAELVARLTARAQGNPFYAEELLNYLHDQGADLRDTAAADALTLPDSMHALVLSRLDQLSMRQQVMLKAASVIGRRFLVAWLHGAYPAILEGMSLKADLDALARVELTPLDTPEPELAYLFKHIVTQEVAYESLGGAMRALLHQQLAGYLEALLGEDAERYLDLLAYHYGQGADIAKKREYLRRAGEAAAARFANDAALAHLSRALELAPQADLAERYSLLLTREKIYDLTGARADQASDLVALESLAEQLADPARRAEVALRRLNYTLALGDFASAQHVAPYALAQAQASGSLRLEAASHYYWGRLLWRQASYAAARQQLETALTLAQGQLPVETEIVIMSLQDLGIVADLGGGRAAARAYFEQALAAARRANNWRRESHILNNLGIISWRHNSYAEARAYFEQALRMSRQISDRGNECKGLGNLALVSKAEGDYERARGYAEEALRLAREIGSPYDESRILGALGAILINQGELLRAQAIYEQGLHLARELDDRQDEVHQLANLGYSALRLGQHAKARACLEESMQLSRGIGNRDSERFGLQCLALLFYHVGEVDVALKYSEEALQLAQETSGPGDEAVAWAFAGHARLMAGQLDGAAEAYQRSWERSQQASSSEPAIEARAGLARVNLERGALAEAMTHVEVILTQLEHGALTADEPLRAYLICFQVLRAADDPRATAVLTAGFQCLDTLAGKIDEPEARRTYRENVPEHRELLAVWEQQRMAP